MRRHGRFPCCPCTATASYAGCLGIRCAAAEILGELDEAAILREAQPDPESLDIIAGSAGALAALLDFHRRTGRCCYQELAIRHGDLLLAEAIREGDTWAWRTLQGMPPLTGFSHGAAGIGWSLLELWKATGEERFRQAALGAFAFERGCFDSDQRRLAGFSRGGSGLPIGLVSRCRRYRLFPAARLADSSRSDAVGRGSHRARYRARRV